MNDYEELLNEDRRIVILRALAEDLGYEHNESVLQRILALYGHKLSRDKVRTLIAWLAEQGLVTQRDISGYIVAALTSRGADVADGSTTVPGVKRPAPKG